MPSSAWKKRSEEHTSELQSHLNLVCRLLLGKRKAVREAPCACAPDGPGTRVHQPLSALLCSIRRAAQTGERSARCARRSECFCFFLRIRRPPSATLSPSRTLCG